MNEKVVKMEGVQIETDNEDLTLPIIARYSL
jgi:hypothetical protein